MQMVFFAMVVMPRLQTVGTLEFVKLVSDPNNQWIQRFAAIYAQRNAASLRRSCREKG